MRFSFPALALLLLATPAWPCDSTACLLQTRVDNGLPGTRRGSVDVSFRATDQGAFFRGSEKVDEVRRPWVDFERSRVWPGFHRERGGSERFLQVDLLYGVGRGAALQLSVPLHTWRDFEVDHGANPYRYYTSGPGDVVLGVRKALADRSRLVGGLSLKTASGRSDITDDAERYVLEPMIQPGTGAVAVAGSLQWVRSIGATGLSFAGSFQHNTINDLDYKAGNDLIASATASRRAFGPVSGSLQVKFWRKYRSTFGGEAVPSTGGRIVYVTPGLRVSLPGRASAYSFVQLPAYRNLNEEQLAPSLGGVIGISKSF